MSDKRRPFWEKYTKGRKDISPVEALALAERIPAHHAVALCQMESQSMAMDEWSKHPIVRLASDLAFGQTKRIRVKDHRTYFDLQMLYGRAGFGYNHPDHLKWWGVEISYDRP